MKMQDYLERAMDGVNLNEEEEQEINEKYEKACALIDSLMDTNEFKEIELDEKMAMSKKMKKAAAEKYGVGEYPAKKKSKKKKMIGDKYGI